MFELGLSGQMFDDRTVWDYLDAAGLPPYTEKVERASRWAFIATFKFKIPSPFTLGALT